MTAFITIQAACKRQGKSLKSVQELKGIDFENVFRRVELRSIFETLNGLMNSSILQDQDYSFIKGPLFNMLKLWIDKA